MYAKQKVMSIVQQLPESMNYGEILEVLSALYIQKYALVDKGVCRVEGKKEVLQNELVLEDL